MSMWKIVVQVGSLIPVHCEVPCKPPLPYVLTAVSAQICLPIPLVLLALLCVPAPRYRPDTCTECVYIWGVLCIKRMVLGAFACNLSLSAISTKTLQANVCEPVTKSSQSSPFHSYRVFHRGVLRVVDQTLGISLSKHPVLR